MNLFHLYLSVELFLFINFIKLELSNQNFEKKEKRNNNDKNEVRNIIIK